MIVLGIDPAMRCTGYGIIDCRSLNDMRLLDCGIIKNQPSMPHSECLRRIAGGINELCENFSVESASIEEAFYAKNVKTAMILSMARGVIVAELAKRSIPVYAHSPRSAKKAVCGYGNASKEQVAAMMASFLNLDISDLALDATDALALAFSHAQMTVNEDFRCLLPEPI